MAGPFYVDSEVNAGGTPNGLSWAAAFDSFWSVPALASGEIVYVASRHVEPNVGASKTLTGPEAVPSARIYSVTTGTTTYAAGAQIKTTGGGYRCTIANSLSFYGITFESGEHFVFSADANEDLLFTNCTFKPAHNCNINCSTVDGLYRFVNCTFDYSNDTSASATNCIKADVWHYNPIEIIGGSFVMGATYDRTGALAENMNVIFYGVDLTDVGTSLEASSQYSRIRLVNCKLPATFTLVGSTPTNNTAHIVLENCPLSGGEGDRISYSFTNWMGTITSDTGVTLDSGATTDDGNDGTQQFSHKYVTRATYPADDTPFIGPWYFVWNDTTGSRNLDIYVGGSEALDNADVWAEYLYLGTSGSEHYTFATTQRATPLTAATEYTTTGGTWSGTGAPTEEYYLRSTVTINEKGWVMGRVCVGKASLTVYVDPRIVLS